MGLHETHRPQLLSRRRLLGSLGAGLLPGRVLTDAAPRELAPGVMFHQGPVNSLLVERRQRRLAVYGDARPDARTPDLVLFTHHRRETASFGFRAVRSGASAVVPSAEASRFRDAAGTWRAFRDGVWRHDYAVQSSRFPVTSVAVTRTVSEGDRIEWEGFTVKVLDTPGYTRGAVSYIIEAPRGMIACTGDLIYGDGQILDLYSLQDAVPEVRIRGYHGFAYRMADVIASLLRLRRLGPYVLVPAHGPLIEDPARAIDGLVRRLRELYANYLYTAAENHYFSADRFSYRTSRILGKGSHEAMPPAEIVAEAPPAWLRPASNSRIVLSASGGALLIDCGLRPALEEVRNLVAGGAVGRLEGIHITHYHDDHTDLADAASVEFDCPVYTGPELLDILAAPSRFRMPCLTDGPIRRLEVWPEGETRRWHEFRITRHYFPGQTIYHDAILIERDRGERVLLAGDSFSPAGMDDYCLLNRNILAPGRGFHRCLDLIERIRPDMIVHQHVAPVFRFSAGQIAKMRRSLERRAAILRELLPWDDPNFGLDEQWARFDPYGVRTAPGTAVDMAVTILNHSRFERLFSVTPRYPAEWKMASRPLTLRIPGGVESSARFRFRVPPDAAGLQVITADVRFGSWELPEWIEALIDTGP